MGAENAGVRTAKEGGWPHVQTPDARLFAGFSPGQHGQ
jgi:hypothetical protein